MRNKLTILLLKLKLFIALLFGGIRGFILENKTKDMFDQYIRFSMLYISFIKIQKMI